MNRSMISWSWALNSSQIIEPTRDIYHNGLIIIILMKKKNFTGNLIGAVLIFLAPVCHVHGQENSVLNRSCQADKTTIILDASVFLDRLHKDHYITDAGRLDVPWIYKNTALCMTTRRQYVINTDIPESGAWYLFARTHGDENSSFRIAVDDRLTDTFVGNQSLNWKLAGAFELEQGTTNVRLMSIEGSPVLDVLVLTRDEGFTEDDLALQESHPDVQLLKSYDIPFSSTVKFGDLTGDGLTDFMALKRDYSVVAFDHDGEELWSWDAPEEFRRQHEPPGLIWDIDRDGSAEALYWRYMDNREWLVAADGTTGEIEYRTEWPVPPLPHAWNNFRLAVANLDGDDYPDQIIVFTDPGFWPGHTGRITITAYTHDLELLWQHEEIKSKDHLGHSIYPVDLTGNGKDEVVVGSLVLNAEGDEIWNRFDLWYSNHDHLDACRFADLTGDGKKEMVAAMSEGGIVVYDALSGDILWQKMAGHSQQVEAGNFLAGVESPQVVVGARSYDHAFGLGTQLHWFTPDGDLAGLWPEKAINGNPMFVKGDWYGNGDETLFWYKFKILENGKGVLYFPEQVYHMFDFMGNGPEEVITLSPGLLRIYGSRNVRKAGADRKSDPRYLYKCVTNHSHYGSAARE